MTTLLPAPILCLPAPLVLPEERRYVVRWRGAMSRVVRKLPGGDEPVTEWDYPERTLKRLSQGRGH
jgi:hypothetical protein